MSPSYAALWRDAAASGDCRGKRRADGATTSAPYGGVIICYTRTVATQTHLDSQSPPARLRESLVAGIPRGMSTLLRRPGPSNPKATADFGAGRSTGRDDMSSLLDYNRKR